MPKLGGRKVGKQPGIASCKVLLVAERNQGQERVLGLLPAQWEQLLAHKPSIFQHLLTQLNQKAVRFEPFFWLHGLAESKGSFCH